MKKRCKGCPMQKCFKDEMGEAKQKQNEEQERLDQSKEQDYLNERR